MFLLQSFNYLPILRNLIDFHIDKIHTVLASELERYVVSGNDIISYASGDIVINNLYRFCSYLQ
jgi:hypothetical protein